MPSRRSFKQRVEDEGLTWLGEFKKGGQGAVFLATDADGRCVAIKKLLNPDRLWRFTAEISAMQRLVEEGCSHVPPVLGQVVDSSVAFYWMPFYEGGSLQDRLDTGQLDDSLQMCRSLVIAMDSVHSHKLSHRDLKPDNVLFDGDRVLLADLGLCREVDANVERLTGEGEQVGPRLFMAPELRDGLEPSVDHRPADVYSLAKIMWCVLTGSPRPFDREARHFEPANLPSTRRSNPALAPVEARLRTWMDLEPSRRETVSTDEMLDALSSASTPPSMNRGNRVSSETLGRLQRRAAARRVEVAEQERRVASSASTRHAELTRRLETWIRNVQERIISAIHASAAWESWCAYADAGRDFLVLTGGTEAARAPIAGYIGLLTGTPSRNPKTSSADQTSPPYFADYELWGVRVGDRVADPRQFTLKATLGTDEVILYACSFQTGRDPQAFETALLPIVESHPPLFESTARRSCELATVVLEAAVAHVEDLARG